MRARLLLLCALLLPAATAARGDTYEYLVDRFEVDGNIYGAHDGVPDLIDGFDDGTMGPTFGPVAGSVGESGGFLHLQSPGTPVSVPGVTPTRFETSAVVQSSWVSSLHAGSGDCVARMVMPAQAIGANDAVNLLVQSVDGTRLYYAGISIANFTASLAARQDPPITPGLTILSHQQVLDVGGNEQLRLEHESIQSVPITGDIVLGLVYDDATRSVTPTYSLDGGVTFAGAFAPLPIESGDGTAAFYLAAVAHEGTCPDAAGITSLRLRNLARPGAGAVALKARLGGDRITGGARRIVITDDGAAGAAVLDLQLPATSAIGCDPRDGWTYPSGRARYANYSNALPPGCAPGSAQGLRLFESRWNGTNSVRVKLSGGSLPLVVGPLRVGFYQGTGPVNECDGAVGTVGCRLRPHAAKCGPKF